MLKKLLILSALVCSFGIQSASATDEVACDYSCPEGQVLISYADGNNVHCSCAQAAQMDATVEDASVQSGGEPTY